MRAAKRLAALLGGPRHHAPVANVVGHRFPASGLGGALMPHRSLVYPIIVPRGIGLGLLTTDGGAGYAIVAPVC
jgi:hypothetical protein